MKTGIGGFAFACSAQPYDPKHGGERGRRAHERRGRGAPGPARPEAAGVEFLNHGRPGVRMRDKQSES
jgi:hypothetical protein